MPCPSFPRYRFSPASLLLAWLAVLGPLFLAPLAGPLAIAGSPSGLTEICTAQGLARLPEPPADENPPPHTGALAHCPLCLFNPPPAVPAGAGPTLAPAAAARTVPPAALRETPAAPPLLSPAQPRAPPARSV
ncbi:DUF2946 family protein [Azovibrio restrictus]|uniref:DUF2946 family protein n=1 Tax=Azovibrio restrictus TaxID=146938 RepID=UPI0026E980D3|nr:DUF2946 family protein [Azovibrio restrictus]